MVVGAALFLGGCGYFNTMYNANRAFADAEKAASRGDLAASEASYRESIEKAQKRITRSPDGRWSGDARLIVARAQFALGDYTAAGTTFRDLLARDRDPERTATAQIYLGVVAAALGEDETLAAAPAQIEAEALLESAQMEAHRRLAHAEGKLGAEKAAMLHERAEDGEGPEIAGRETHASFSYQSSIISTPSI